MKRFATVATFTVATLGWALATIPAHAQWVNDGATCTNWASHDGGGGGNAKSGTSISSSAASTGAPPTTYSNYCTATYRQDFHWSGGGTPTTSFTATGSGTLDGYVTTSGDAHGEASSKVRIPSISFIYPWVYPDTMKTPNGPITVRASGTTTSFTWYLDAAASGAGGSGAGFGAGYNSYGSVNYTISGP